MRREPGVEPEEAISKRGKKTKRQDGNPALAKVRDYDAHVLVCNGADCKERGSKGVRKALKVALRNEGIDRDVRMDSVDCLGLCKHGPNLVIYPPGTWYVGLIEDDAASIAREHLKDGEPVGHLAAGLRYRKKAK